MPPNDKFDVYVEGVRDKSPQGVQRAAQLLAPRLSMPAEKVAKLLAGRFRVRTGVDEDMGRKLVGDLEAFGLRVVIVPQGAKPGPAPAPAAKPAAPTAPAARPPAPAARPLAQAPTIQASPPPAPMPVEDADGGISIGGLELMGNSTPAAEPPPPSAPAAPAALQPQGFMPSSFGPPPDDNDAIDLAAPAPAPPPKPIAKAAPPPVDPFAPPDAPADHGIDLDVAGPKARTSQPPAAKRSGTTIPPQAAASSSQRMSAIKMKQKVGEARARALRGGLVVLVLAVAVGYFPGHLYAKHVDDTKVVELQKEYRQLEVNPWKGEATHRTKERVRDEIHEIRWNAMLLMMGIWAACSGLLAALAYVLF